MALHGQFLFLKILNPWEYEWDGSSREITIRDRLTKTYSKVEHLNDSDKMVADNQPVTEGFQLSSPSTWEREGDGGKFLFFSMGMMEMRWIERVHDGEREREDR